MSTLDYSAEVLQTFYGKSSKVLCVELNSGEILLGIFVGFFHGDPDNYEPLVTAWRFVSKSEIDDYQLSPEKYREFGRIIQQSEIKSVQFNK